MDDWRESDKVRLESPVNSGVDEWGNTRQSDTTFSGSGNVVQPGDALDSSSLKLLSPTKSQDFQQPSTTSPQEFPQSNIASQRILESLPSSSKNTNSSPIPPPFQASENHNRPDSVGPPPISSLPGKGQSGSILPERAVEPQLFKGVSSNGALSQWQQGAEYAAKPSTHPSVETSKNVSKEAESSTSNVFDRWREADLAKTKSLDTKSIAGSSDTALSKGERSELRRSFSDSGLVGEKVVSQTFHLRSDSGHSAIEQQKSTSSASALAKHPESAGTSAFKQSLSDVSPRSILNSGKGLVSNVVESAELATRAGNSQRIDSSASGTNSGKIAGVAKQDFGENLRDTKVGSETIKSGRGLDNTSDSTGKRGCFINDRGALSGPQEKINTASKSESIQQPKDSVSKSGDSKLVHANNPNPSAGVIGLIHDLKPDFSFVNRLKADKGVFNNKDKGSSAFLTGGGSPESRPDKPAPGSDKSKRVTEGLEASSKVGWGSKIYTGYLFPFQVRNAKAVNAKGELVGTGSGLPSEMVSEKSTARSLSSAKGDSSSDRVAGREGRRSIFQILDGYLSKRNEKAGTQVPDSRNSDLDRYLPKSDYPNSPGSSPKSSDSAPKFTSISKAGDPAPGSSGPIPKVGDLSSKTSSPKSSDSALPPAVKPQKNPREQNHPYKPNEVVKAQDKSSPPNDAARIPAILAGNYYPESFSIVARKVKVLEHRQPATERSQVGRPQSNKLKSEQSISHCYVVRRGLKALSLRKRKRGLFRSLAVRIGEYAYLTTDLLPRNTYLSPSEGSWSLAEGSAEASSPSSSSSSSIDQLTTQWIPHSFSNDGETDIPIPNSDLIPEFLQQMTKALPPVVRLHLPGNSYSSVDLPSTHRQADENHRAEKTVKARNAGFNTSLPDKNLIEQANKLARDVKKEAGSSWGARREGSANAGVNGKIDLGQTELEVSGWGAVGGGASSMTEKWQKTRASRELAESSRQNAEHMPNAKDKQKPPDCAANEKCNIGYSNRVSRDSIGHISIFEEDSEEPQDSTVEMSSIPVNPAIAKISPGLLSSKGRSTRRYTNPDLDDQDETLISAYEDDTETSEGAGWDRTKSGNGNGADRGAFVGVKTGDDEINKKSKSSSSAFVEAHARALNVSSGEPGFTNCLYIVREGETVESIANDLLKDPRLAALIFEKNHRHVLPSQDYGVHPLKAGATIELPTASEREKFYASRCKDK